jgi:putative endonuclease
MHRPYYCYILECSDGTYYTGWTVNPERRVAVHNKGRGARYTRTRCPVKLVYVEELPDQKSAMKREIAIKRMKRDMKMRLIGGRVVRGEKKKEKSMGVNL